MTQARPRLGVSSASLPSLAPEALVDELARLGYQGVEWRVAAIDGLDASRAWDARSNNRCTLPPCEQAITRVQQRCQANGLQIFGLSPYLTVGDLDPALRLIDLAALAGNARLRLWAPAYDREGYAATSSRMRHFLDQLLPRAEAAGVRLALEVHQRTICSSPSLAMRIAEHYPAQHLGIIYDLGNLAIEGREDVGLSLDLMGEHLAHVQVKNVAWVAQADHQCWRWEWCPPDQGVLPLREMLQTLAERGFVDWLSVEDFDSTWPDAHKLLRNRELMQRYLDLDAPVAPVSTPEVFCP